MKRRPRKALTSAEAATAAGIEWAGIRQVQLAEERSRHRAGAGGVCLGCRHNGLMRQFPDECQYGMNG